MKGLILEGITGSGKTTLLRALVRRLAESWRGPVWVATEHVTERVLEPLKEATGEEVCRHIDTHLEHLKHLSQWDSAAPKGSNTETLFILERFHFSLGLHIPGLSKEWLKATDQRLAIFQPLVVWCRLEEQDIPERSVLRPSQERGRQWNAYLQTLGADPEEQFRHFAREQQRLAKFLSDSVLCTYPIQVNRATIGWLADEIWRKVGVFGPEKPGSNQAKTA